MRKKSKEKKPKLWDQVPGEKDKYGMTIPTRKEREGTLQKIRDMANRRRQELAEEKKKKQKP